MGKYNIMEICNPPRTILNFYLQHTVKGWAETSKEETAFMEFNEGLNERAKIITNKCLFKKNLFIYFWLSLVFVAPWAFSSCGV